MTINRVEYAALPPPPATRAADSWNSASAALPGLVSFLQPSVDSTRIESDGGFALHDRVARAWWASAASVAPGTLGPNLIALQSGVRSCLEWPGTSDVNPLGSPAGFTLPAEGTIILVVELAAYDAACTILKSATTTGNYVKIALTADGEVEVTGASGTVLAATAAITPYDGPLQIMFSWSASACKVSVNGVEGETTSGAYEPNDDALNLCAGLDGGSRLYAAVILDVPFHATAHAATATAYMVSTAQAFGLPFTVDWDFSDLGPGKLWLDLDPSGLTDGDVTSWTDSASGIVFTEATHPPSKSVDGDGIAWLEFDASSEERIRCLTIPSAAPTGEDAGEIHILIDALDNLDDTSTGTPFGYGAAGATLGRRFERTCNGEIARIKATTNNAGSYAWSTADYLNKHVIGGRWQDGIEYLYFDGTLASQLATPIATSSTGRIAVGCSQGSEGSPTGFVSQKIGRIIGTRAITDAERDLITGRLAWLGGLQSLLPDGHPYKRATFV